MWPRISSQAATLLSDSHLWQRFLKGLHGQHQRSRSAPVIVPEGENRKPGKIILSRPKTAAKNNLLATSPLTPHSLGADSHHQVGVVDDGRVFRKLLVGDDFLVEALCKGRENADSVVQPLNTLAGAASAA